jgi:phage shock protein A
MNFANESEYKFIQQDKDGKFYLTEQAVIDLANYIKQLQDLNNNYLAQIDNLKKQIDNLEKQIANLEQQILSLQEEKKKLEQELAMEKMKTITWTVVAAITIGTTIYLFIK